MKKVGIYIHIPFCKQKCKYCDFVSFQCAEEKAEEYFKCLVKEIVEEADKLKFETVEKNIEIDTIYIGGGTPSAVSENFIEKIIYTIKENYNVSKNAEITIEINPGTVDENKLKKYFEIGINRVSIGLQSANNKLLNMLGRIHNYEQFEDTYNLARKVGFENINVDLMIGLPNQSIDDVEVSVKEIIKKFPEHISVYSLIVEENTKMFELIENNCLELPSEELERKMYWKVKKNLEEYGYKHYEISNFAKKDKDIICITPGMCYGSKLNIIKEKCQRLKESRPLWCRSITRKAWMKSLPSFMKREWNSCLQEEQDSL